MERRTKTLLLIGAGVAVVYFLTRNKAPARVTSNASGTTPGIVEQLTAEAGALMTQAANVLRQIAQSTLNVIKGFEGFSAKAYPDAGGYSIGYGHYLGTKPIPATTTQQQAADWLLQDATKAANAIRKYVKVPLTQNQFDALTSWLYNVGEGHLPTSTLLKLLNAGNYTGAADQFRRWVYSQGKVNTVLQQRREKERALFLAPDSEKAA